MKIKVILVKLVFGLLSYYHLDSKEIPTCTCVPLNYYDGHGMQDINRDTSIVFDTCGVMLKYSSCDSSYVQNVIRYNEYGDSVIKKVLSKGYWHILFTKQAINLPIYPKDTAVYVTWEDIDTTLILERSVFKSLDSVYGHYVMKKKRPADSSGKLS